MVVILSPIMIFGPIMQLTVPSTSTIYYGADPLRRVPSSARRLRCPALS